jgi:hypothetical protein
MALAVVLKMSPVFRDKQKWVFKKRPNFLNSAPIITKSALWLLSAPSVTF